ncbi:MAG TPA: hypothetical protein VIQ27_03465 [Gemmatimonadales bacterium]|jgi:hypothetical protein
MSVEPSVSGDPVPPSRAWRVKVSLAAGLVAGLFVIALYASQRPDVISDWDPTWVATTALLRGESPYAAIQVPPWPNWLLYPLPALVITAPFTFIPLPLARGIFVAIGAATFTYVITRRHRWTLYFLISGAMLWSWMVVQWQPLLIAAVLTPALSWLLPVKPTVGFALWSGWPSRRAVIGGLLFVGLTLLLRPGWIQEWLASVAKTPHSPHLLRPGGFLLLLGLLRWRRSEGRLLAALSLVPQTTALYETLPLALLCRDRPQAAAFASLTMLAHLVYLLGPQGPWPVGAEYQWWVLLFLVYGPAVVLVLRRPNESEPQAFI